MEPAPRERYVVLWMTIEDYNRVKKKMDMYQRCADRQRQEYHGGVDPGRTKKAIEFHELGRTDSKPNFRLEVKYREPEINLVMDRQPVLDRDIIRSAMLQTDTDFPPLTPVTLPKSLPKMPPITRKSKARKEEPIPVKVLNPPLKTFVPDESIQRIPLSPKPPSPPKLVIHKTAVPTLAVPVPVLNHSVVPIPDSHIRLIGDSPKLTKQSTATPVSSTPPTHN